MLNDDQIVLTPIEKNDIDLFLEWFNNPEITQYLQFFLPLTREAEEKWFEENASSKNSVIFTIRPVNKKKPGDNLSFGPKIGNIGLHQISWKDQSATLGIAIGDVKHQGKGNGTRAVNLLLKYAFEQLNLLRIESHVYAFNERSIRLHKKFGFQLEGTRRKAVYKNGQHSDIHIFGLLKNEWEKQPRNQEGKMELRNETEKMLWRMPCTEEEKVQFILQYRQEQEEDKQRALRREKTARKLGLIP